MSGALQSVDMGLSAGSLDAYIQRINQIPMLTAEQEQDLAVRFTDNDDLGAARQLVPVAFTICR